MSLFSFLNRRQSTEDHALPARECLHMELAPRWLEAGDIGKSDRASSFVCASCGRTFTPEEARELRTASVA